MNVIETIECFIICYIAIFLRALVTWSGLLTIILLFAFIAAFFMNLLPRFFLAILVSLVICFVFNTIFFVRMMKDPQGRHELEYALKRFKAQF